MSNDEKDICMTSYFRPLPINDNDLPEDFPWANWDEFRKEMELVVDHMKSEGVRLGHLEVTPEGWLKGHGHPDEWFDTVDIKLNDDRD